MNLYDKTGALITVDPVALVAKFIGKGVTCAVKPHRSDGYNGYYAPDKVKEREANLAKGLTADGKPRQRPWQSSGGLLKTNPSLYKRESKYWRLALANLWEQAGDGVFGSPQGVLKTLPGTLGSP